MEDRKLLEAAAKAAGLHYHGVRVGLDYENCYVSRTNDTDDWYVWTPHTDLGQAASLLLALRLRVEYVGDQPCIDGVLAHGMTVEESFCRAVVRAAAAMCQREPHNARLTGPQRPVQE